MNTDRLNGWLALLANIGVLIGIILLLVELNQNQGIARAQIRNEMFQGLTEVLSLTDRDLADLLARANAGETLNPADMIIVSGWSEGMLRYWENANYQFEMGMYDDTEYSAHKNTIRRAILELFPGSLIPHYCINKSGYSEHYRSLVDEMITPEMCDAVR